MNEKLGHVRTEIVRHHDRHRLAGSQQSLPAWKPLPHHLSGKEFERGESELEGMCMERKAQNKQQLVSARVVDMPLP